MHGRELMLITENDLLKPLIERGIVRSDSEVLLADQKDVRYPIKRHGHRTLIFDSNVLDMLDNVGMLCDLGIDVLRMDLSMYGKRDVVRWVTDYRRAVKGDNTLRSGKGPKYSHGHYFKGV